MKRIKGDVLLGAVFIALSALLYFIHYFIFRDAHHIFIYLLADIAFLPIEVLLVTLIIEKLLNDRDKKVMCEKLNMVIGVFFTEVGKELLAVFSKYNYKLDDIKGCLIIKGDWTEKDFAGATKKIRKYYCSLKVENKDLVSLSILLVSKKEFLIGLLQNPVLLEHETFTELLMAVFHLEQELSKRRNLLEVYGSDKEHIENDIVRIYKLLLFEWIVYMKHLKYEYPYLFSLEARTNPLDESASVELK